MDAATPSTRPHGLLRPSTAAVIPDLEVVPGSWPRMNGSVAAEPNTLLPRFMGVHRLALPRTGKVHFVVMANVFATSRVIHERYGH